MPDIKRKNKDQQSHKEPWLAINLSMIFPGLGHIYVGKPLQGWGIAFAYLTLVLVSFFSVITVQGSGFLSFLATALLMLLGFGSWISAYKAAIRANDKKFEDLRKPFKDPWLAVFLSRFILGAGHLYMGKWILGSILIVAELLIWMYSPWLGLFSIWLSLPFIANNAYQSASEQRKNSRNLIFQLFLLLVVAPIAMLLLVVFVIRSSIGELRYIRFEGMRPTLHANDRVTVDKVNYRFQDPQRGDIVVFSPPKALQRTKTEHHSEDAEIKRIIGLPGDYVEIKQGSVWINKQPWQEPYTKSGNTSGPNSTICRFNYVTMDQESRAIDPPIPIYFSKPQTIPADHYFLLGDNRDNSFDSRCWGLVKRSEIIGQATKRIFPFRRMGRL